MTEYANIARTVTKAEHDAIVARKGRPFTQSPMRHARPVDDDASSSGMTALDRAVAVVKRSK